tara:strand:+ start:29 stop:154 length:126 start_codon:yes stop_codon:yes gene_type:complete
MHALLLLILNILSIYYILVVVVGLRKKVDNSTKTNKTKGLM